MGINGLIVLRLFYFGDRDLLSRIAVIEYSKKWLLDSRWFINSYINGLTITIFTFCAIPLFTLIYLINTDKMRVTGIAIILFTFFIAIENSTKGRAANKAKSAPADVPAAKEGAAHIAAQGGTEEELAYAEDHIKDQNELLRLTNAVIIAGFFICLLMIQGEGQKKFLFGYAFGYADGKNDVKPKAEVRLERLVKCYDRGSGGRGSWPDPACRDVYETAPPKSAPPKIEPPKK